MRAYPAEVFDSFCWNNSFHRSHSDAKLTGQQPPVFQSYATKPHRKVDVVCIQRFAPVVSKMHFPTVLRASPSGTADDMVDINRPIIASTAYATSLDAQTTSTDHIYKTPTKQPTGLTNDVLEHLEHINRYEIIPMCGDVIVAVSRHGMSVPVVGCCADTMIIPELSELMRYSSNSCGQATKSGTKRNIFSSSGSGSGSGSGSVSRNSSRSHSHSKIYDGDDTEFQQRRSNEKNKCGCSLQQELNCTEGDIATNLVLLRPEVSEIRTMILEKVVTVSSRASLSKQDKQCHEMISLSNAQFSYICLLVENMMRAVLSQCSVGVGISSRRSKHEPSCPADSIEVKCVSRKTVNASKVASNNSIDINKFKKRFPSVNACQVSKIHDDKKGKTKECFHVAVYQIHVSWLPFDAMTTTSKSTDAISENEEFEQKNNADHFAAAATAVSQSLDTHLELLQARINNHTVLSQSKCCMG